MSVGKALLVAALLVLAAASGCGDGSDPSSPSDSQNVATEPGQAETATIGSDGGTLSATSSAGIVYTLTVPPDGLAVPQTITLTPVTAIANLTLAGGLVGGVDLEPSGLVLDAPATLTISANTVPPAGQLAIAIGYAGDAAAIMPAFHRHEAGVWTLPISHFSGAAMGFGTTQDLATLVGVVAQGGSATFIAQLVAALSLTPRDGRTELDLFVSWFQTVLLPQIEQASNDQELHLAISQLQHWAECIPLAETCTILTGSPSCAEALDPLHAAARDALAPQIRTAIFGNNEVCAGQESLAALLNVLFWQRQAEHFGIATAENQLDLDSILAGICAKPVLESFVLADPLSAGFPYSLDLNLALRFGEHAEAQAMPFAVDLSAMNATLQHPTGFTNAQGFYTTVITADGNGPITVTGQACLVLPGLTQPSPICGNIAIEGRALDLTGTWEGTLFDTRTSPQGEVEHFVVPVIVTLAQNQNAISGSYAAQGGGAGGVSATLSGGELLNYTLSQTAPCAGSFVGQATVSFDGNTIEAGFNGSSCMGTHVGTSTVTRSSP